MIKLKEIKEILGGYNPIGRSAIYIGTITGALAPIIIGKYLFDGFYPENPTGELLSWTSSILINVSPILKDKAPVPIYTALLGLRVGFEVANKFFIRKNGENKLEKIIEDSNLKK